MLIIIVLLLLFLLLPVVIIKCRSDTILIKNFVKNIYIFFLHLKLR